MLIHKKIYTKCLLIGLLLIFQMNAIATIPACKGFQDTLDLALPAEIRLPQNGTSIQDKTVGNIDFQINSEITYLTIGHFRKAESKQAFLDALSKEKKARLLTDKTDDLRNAYASSPDDEKEKIAAQILENEKTIMALNDEIPALYEKARSGEKLYWQTADAEEKTKFLARVNSFRDSLQQIEMSTSERPAIVTTVPDTIIYYQASKLNEVVAEPAPAVVYKIQVGSFKTRLPDSAAKAIKKLELLRKVESYKDENGLTVLTTGNLKLYKEALTMQTQVKLEGIKNATISAYKNGKRIPLEDAKKLSNETNIKP